ncbi:Nudix family hydrolase [Lysobacter yangpyeongensis]|uniref:8-oxo-dGTP diphosphatase n=1 Tax=Lysobacter yangpyeongensis TaxID=346182 RepID=A0ABW0SN25_9GAMM
MPTAKQETIPAATAPAGAPRVIEVVAGVIRDRRGRILLARRTEGRDLAGLWEFPGGKHEAGETAEAALKRELREELGIAVEPGDRVIRVPQAYPHKRLCLDVYDIRAWTGTVRGLEGQALAWVPPHKLADYPMPPADVPVVAALTQPDCYLVTPEPGGEEDATWLASLERALAAGIRRVHLRAPACERGRWRTLAGQAVAVCREAGAQVLVNADAELAQALGTGLHLRASQLRTLAERPLPRDLPVAASCHTLEELRLAQALGCGWAVVGAIKPTASHPDAMPLGWATFAAMRESVALPIYAIGGLTPDDIAEARRHGAQGVAAIRGLWPAA